MSGASTENSFSRWPDAHGRFGEFGGRFVPEVLMPALQELEEAYRLARQDHDFQREYRRLLQEYVGRPNPLTAANRLSAEAGGAAIFLKREDLNHTGAHKINNALGQLLLAARMGKHRIIAETGAGQHGVAAATAAAHLGLACRVYMGEVDIARQRLNVLRMRLLGAEVVPVKAGSRTLKDAINEAIRDWVTNVRDTFYCIGSAVGPHPYPQMVRDFQSVIGEEARRQILQATGHLPDAVVACVGGGSNAIGTFFPFLEDREVRLFGVEAGGRGSQPGEHAATLTRGSTGVLHGMYSLLLQNDDGQISPVHSVSAGLDYPGVGPEHAFLQQCGRVSYSSVGDDEALAAMQQLARSEGIIPALESAHALAFAVRLAAQMPRSANVLVCLSGRGDKDMETVAELLDEGERHD